MSVTISSLDLFQRVAVFGVLDRPAQRGELSAQRVARRPVFGLSRSPTLFRQLSDVVGDVLGLFLVALVASTIGLAIAMKSIPTATAYAVWTGIGASLTVVWAMITGTEPFSALRITLIAILIACIIGLKFSEDGSHEETSPGNTPS